MQTHYNGKISDEALLEGAKQGMVAGLGDDYTVYMNAKDAAEFNKELSGEIGGGIGAEIGLRNGQPTIIRTLPDNPAEKAGVHAGDTIVAVNDESTRDWAVDKTVGLIRGAVGTSVKVGVNRAGEIKEISITRAEINNPSVSSKLDGTTGILTVSRFDNETESLARRAASELKRGGATSIVLDMRGNGGGYLDAAPGFAGMWLDNKAVVTVRDNRSSDTMKSSGEPILKGMKTTVLVNGSTASAAEIVAAALKDNGVATIIGEKTFGKGTVQEIIPLNNGAQLKVTIKRWFTPKNVNVTKNGIKPDTAVGLEQKDLDAGTDPQLQAAIAAARS